MSIETRFGPYGGRFVPETLIPALDELTAAYEEAAGDTAFQAELRRLLAEYAGRPTPAVPRRAAQRALRRDRSCSSARTSATPARTRSTTSSARRCWPGAWASAASSPRPAPASTAWPPPPPAPCSTSSAPSTWAPRTCAGRSSTSCACVCSAPRCVPVESGSRTLKDAMNEALRDWVTNVRDTFYSSAPSPGPHPYPAHGPRLPGGHRRRGHRAGARARSGACRTRSSPASAAAPTPWASSTRSATSPPCGSIGVEAAGEGLDGRHAPRSPRAAGRAARLVQLPAAGRLGPGGRGALASRPAWTTRASGPSTAWLKDSGRAAYAAATDEEALAAFRTLVRARGHHPGAGERPRRGLRAARALEPEPTAPSPS